MENSMKIAFLEDVPNVARAGDIKEVADGYARNYLLPKKLAVPASPGVASTIEEQRQSRSRKETQRKAELAALGQKLEGTEIKLEAKAGSKDRLYGAITTAEIAAQLESQIGITIDKKKIELTEPIRKLGSHQLSVKLGHEITPKITVTVAAKEAE
jgi:large subunit ribosomal protein L9